MKELLKSVLDGKVESVSIPYAPPSEIEKILKELGIDTKQHDININGWDVDFWIYYKYKNERYIFSGSWFYGKYNFSKE